MYLKLTPMFCKIRTGHSKSGYPSHHTGTRTSPCEIFDNTVRNSIHGYLNPDFLKERTLYRSLLSTPFDLFSMRLTRKLNSSSTFERAHIKIHFIYFSFTFFKLPRSLLCRRRLTNATFRSTRFYGIEGGVEDRNGWERMGNMRRKGWNASAT